MLDHTKILLGMVTSDFSDYYEDFAVKMLNLRSLPSKQRISAFKVAGEAFNVSKSPGAYKNPGVYDFCDFLSGMAQLCLTHKNTSVEDFLGIADLSAMIEMSGCRPIPQSKLEQAELLYDFIARFKLRVRKILIKKMAINYISKLKSSSQDVPLSLIALVSDKNKIHTIYSRYDYLLAKALGMDRVQPQVNSRQCFKDLALYSTLIELEPSRILGVLSYPDLQLLNKRILQAPRSIADASFVWVLQQSIKDATVCSLLGQIYPCWLPGAVNHEIAKRKRISA